MPQTKKVGLVPQVSSQVMQYHKGVPQADIPALLAMLKQSGMHIVTVNAGHIVKVQPVSENILEAIEAEADVEADDKEEEAAASAPKVTRKRTTRSRASKVTKQG